MGFNWISKAAKSLKPSQLLHSATEVAHRWSAFHMLRQEAHLEMEHDRQ